MKIVAIVVAGAVMLAVGLIAAVQYVPAGLTLMVAGIVGHVVGQQRVYRLMENDGIPRIDMYFVPGRELLYSIKHWRKTWPAVVLGSVSLLMVLLGASLLFLVAISHPAAR